MPIALQPTAPATEDVLRAVPVARVRGAVEDARVLITDRPDVDLPFAWARSVALHDFGVVDLQHRVRQAGEDLLANSFVDRLEQLCAADRRVAHHAARQRQSFGRAFRLEPRAWHVVGEALEDDLCEEVRSEQALVQHSRQARRDQDLTFALRACDLLTDHLVDEGELDALELSARHLADLHASRLAARAGQILSRNPALDPLAGKVIWEVEATLGLLPRVLGDGDRLGFCLGLLRLSLQLLDLLERQQTRGVEVAILLRAPAELATTQIGEFGPQQIDRVQQRRNEIAHLRLIHLLDPHLFRLLAHRAYQYESNAQSGAELSLSSSRFLRAAS